jgi:hypothetical protein
MEEIVRVFVSDAEVKSLVAVVVQVDRENQPPHANSLTARRGASLRPLVRIEAAAPGYPPDP